MPAALQEFNTAVTLSPLSGAAHRWYGEALAENGQLDAAVLQLEQAVDLEASLDSMRDLVNVYLRQGRTAQAEPLLRRMTVQFRYESLPHFLLARILEDAGKRDQALSEYQAGLASDPKNIEAQVAMRRLLPKK